MGGKVEASSTCTLLISNHEILLIITSIGPSTKCPNNKYDISSLFFAKCPASLIDRVLQTGSTFPSSTPSPPHCPRPHPSSIC